MLAVLALVLTHAHVLTMSPRAPVASTLAVVDGRIAYVGDDEQAAWRAAGPQAEELALGGRTVMPGFNDAHVHFGDSITAYGARGVSYFHQPMTRRQFIAAVEKAARDPARKQHGWFFVTINDMPAGISGAADLDFFPRPLFVITEHGGLLNTRALRTGLFLGSEAPGGFIRGGLLNHAVERVIQAQPHQELIEGARNFLAELARLGITSVQIMDELPEIFDELRRAGQLTARVRMIPFGYRFDTTTYHSDWKAAEPEWLRVEGVKYFHDSWARITRYELKQVYESVVAARRQTVVHVISKRALDSFLTAIETMSAGHPADAHLFRIDHVDEAGRDEALRLARLGVMVCSNPAMIPEWATEHAFPMRTLLDAGVKLCIGTDWIGDFQPPRLLSPLSGLQLAVTHGGFGSAERITVNEALAAYTEGSAAAEGEADLKGTLQPNMMADLIVLSGDPLVTAPAHLSELEVLLTMVGGRVVYRRGGFGAPPPTTIGEPPPTTIGAPRPSIPRIGPAKKQ